MRLPEANNNKHKVFCVTMYRLLELSGSKWSLERKDKREFKDQAGIGPDLHGGFELKTPLIYKASLASERSIPKLTKRGRAKAHLYAAIVRYFLFNKTK